MPGRPAIEVRLLPGGGGDAVAPRWRMSLLENTFSGFLQGAGADAAARAVFADGSLFSPFLFGKFFDPADPFPLWEFESDVLLAALRRGNARTTVDWAETDSEYYLRADIPGTNYDRCQLHAFHLVVHTVHGLMDPCESLEMVLEHRTETDINIQ